MAVRIVTGPDGEPREVNSTDHVETASLAELAAEIKASLTAGKMPAAGALLGLPPLDGDVWSDIAGAVAVTGFPRRTIAGWLSRGGPKRCPFPAPRRYLYRLYWPLSELQAWLAEYRQEHGTGQGPE